MAEKELIPLSWPATYGASSGLGGKFGVTDNEVVVASLRSNTSQSKGLMDLLRCIVFLEARNGFYLHPSYIPSAGNHLANELSQTNLTYFLLKVLSAKVVSAPVSQLLFEALLYP